MDLRINGKSIYDSQIFAVFLAIVFVEPAYFGQIEALNNVYTYIQLFFTIFLLILSIIERKWTASSICIYLFFGTILLTTIFGSGNAVRQNYIYPLKMDSMMVKILGVNSIVNLILSAILIPYIGIYGAVIGTISAELVGMIIEMYVCRKYLSIKNVLANMLPFAAIGAIMYVCVRAVAQFYDGSLMALLVQVVVGATVYLVLTTVYAFASKSLIWEVIMSVIDRVRKRLIKR